MSTLIIIRAPTKATAAVALGDYWFDAAIAQCLSMRRGILAVTCVDRLRFLQRTASHAKQLAHQIVLGRQATERQWRSRILNVAGSQINACKGVHCNADIRDIFQVFVQDLVSLLQKVDSQCPLSSNQPTVTFVSWAAQLDGRHQVRSQHHALLPKKELPLCLALLACTFYLCWADPLRLYQWSVP
ncbi:hypothetical protein [Burkholderia ubonensis]|uniref:hypothetical protein n=1 Tax=Burkholderia ubonensis TaxID=101571 RepID=UPI0012F97DDE|nr:hypothetical protein [Burkholderia ubonensis]